MPQLVVGSIVIMLSLVLPTTVAAQSQEQELAALRAELEVLKAGQGLIQKDLEEIKRLLQQGSSERTQPLAENFLAVGDAPFKGNAEAPITLIEFSDYQCPFCARHARDTLAEIDKRYVSTGKVRYVFRNFPIEGIHPLAFRAHEAAACAAEQGKFWEMHTRLFANPKALGAEELPKHAEGLGLEMTRFRSCFDSRRLSMRVRQDIAEGRALGVSGTPMFFIGVTQPEDGKVKVLRMLRGAQDFEAFRTAIDSLLAAAR
jgi:protein-disulfide isomerase